jgi:hypothetical protein
MTFLEPLPPGCPPAEGLEIKGPQDVYRLVRTNPASLDDFRSQRAEKPDATFNGVTECQACGVSVHTDRSDTLRLLKLPGLRGRLVARITLDAGAGVLLQTGRSTHHTWWPLRGFDLLGACEVEPA